MKPALVVLAAAFAAADMGAATPGTTADAFEIAAAPVPATPLDKIVFSGLAKLKAHPTFCSDAVFVRRAYLDVIGTLPTAQEARDFIRDPDTANKRRRLIDRLLERPEFADYWAMRWGDILRIKAEFPVNLWPNAAQAYHHWVRAAIAANKPYDQFARELLTSSGSNFRVGPVNFFRAVQNRTPDGIATAVALVFMGSRVSSWRPERLARMAAFYSQIGYKPTSEWKEEYVFWDPLGASRTPGNTAPGRDAIAPKPPPKTAAEPPPPPAPPTPPAATASAPHDPVFPDGKKAKLSPDRDPREVFADWLITPKNPWFTRAIANRVWYWLMGRGVIHEPDDIRPDNPPSNRALLAYLEKEMVRGRYDLKAYYRLILNSQAYQLSSIPHLEGPKAAASFASYPVRRLDAEVLIDAINKVTGTTDLYTSPIPEPFTFIPEDKPAVALPDGSITSPFLALFGRPARATGMENERDHKPLPAQWLHLLNSSHIQRKLDQGPTLRTLFTSGRKTRDILDELYLSVLSRFPTDDEAKNAEQYTSFKTAARPVANRPPPPKRREDWVDIAWSLVNSIEFRYRH